MHNLGTVFSFEFMRTIKKPTFWISALSVPILGGIIFGIVYFSNVNADKAAQKNEEKTFSIQVKDDSGLINIGGLRQAGIAIAENKEAGIEAVKKGKVEAFFYYPNDPSKQTIEAYGKDTNLFENGRYEAVASEILQQNVAASIGSETKVELLQKKPSVETITFKNGEQAPGFERLIGPGIFLLLFYFASFMFAGQMLTSTTEEKENRVTEMILTTIKARTLIVGKILAIIALGLLQMLIILVPVLLGYLFFREQFNLSSVNLAGIPLDPIAITIGALLFVSSFILLTGLSVAIGAAVPTAKEANSFMGAIYLPLFAPFWAFAAIMTDASQLIVQIFSYFPLTAPTTLLLRNTFGNLALHEALIGISIVAVTGIIAIGIAVRVFRYGTVEYSRQIGLKEIFTRKG